MEKMNDRDLDAIVGGFNLDYAKKMGVFVGIGANGKEYFRIKTFSNEHLFNSPFQINMSPKLHNKILEIISDAKASGETIQVKCGPGEDDFMDASCIDFNTLLK